MSNHEEREESCCGGGCGCSHHHEQGDASGHGHDHGECCCGGHGDSMASASEAENREIEFPKDVPLPAPSLLTLSTSIATQAMVSMGVFPHPLTGKSEFMLHQAKHLIDTVEMLIEKTAGNRTDEESKTLESMLHELHMLFLAAQNEKAKRDGGE